MPQFRYRALNSQGHELEGTLTAADANAAVTQLSRQGLRLKSIEEGVVVRTAPPTYSQVPQTAPSQPVRLNPISQPKLNAAPSQVRPMARESRRSTYNDRRFIFAQLAGLLRTGISPADALNTILSRSSSSKFREPFIDMARMCAEGTSLSDAMAHYPNIFPSGTVGAVRAGETGGYLPDACDTIALQQKETRSIFMWFAGLGISLPWFFVLLMIGISIAAGINRGIDSIVEGTPGPAVQEGIRDAWKGIVGWLFGLTVVGFLVAYFAGRMRQFRNFRHRFGLSVPVFKKRAIAENLSHFSYHLGRLAKSGLSPFASWQLAASAVPNEAYSAKLMGLATNMNEQTKLSELMFRSKLFPMETAQLVETGEVTGDLPNAMDQVMDYSREKEKEAKLYIGIKAGCWTFMVFFLGGSIVFLVVYLTYFRGVFRIIEDI
jgi:type II secretory pathway component PulF